MAGFIISIDKKTKIEDVVFNGYFTPKTPENIESQMAKMTTYLTLGDFLSMNESDNIYFFQKRKIYGVGKLVNISGQCYYENYEDSTLLQENNNEINYLTPNKNKSYKWLLLFEPDIQFFSDGVDMDDVLKYKPESFKMLRAFQDRSFIKIDDEENDALKQFIYLRNKENKSQIEFSNSFHNKLKSIDLSKYEVNIDKIIKHSIKEDKTLNYEATLEACLVKKIVDSEMFGLKWDYVSHQVIASPFKPIAYIDKIDIFAYKFLDYPHETKPIEKYLIVELKKDKANKGSIEQTMKYVDWVCHEYASGDYSLIKAIVIANSFTNNSFKELEELTNRTFIKSTHPIVTEVWNDLSCYNYSISDNYELDITQIVL